MGCFTVLYRKKKDDRIFYSNRYVDSQEHSTTLPEPIINSRTLQSAPPSFKIRVKPVLSNNTKASIGRTRTLSAPSSLEEDIVSSNYYEEQDDFRSHVGSKIDLQPPSPQPLPLPPSPKSVSTLKSMDSFKVGHSSGPLDFSGPLPLPPTFPLAFPCMGTLRNFSYEEIAAACFNFSPERCISEGHSSAVYRASFGDESPSRRIEATIVLLHSTNQGLKEFVNEVNTLATLQHPSLCKLLGFHAREVPKYKMLVYGRLFHGSLDRLLHGRSDGPPIDWNTRMKVALCAAQGLTFLHEEGPFQAMFHEFTSANIQIDKDFSAKLSGYGCIKHTPETDMSFSSSVTLANTTTETQERGLLTPKSDVWSFGIVLLELLTGRRNLDARQPREERNLVKWSRPFLADDCRLSLIMDPQLKGRFPAKAIRVVADMAQKCLQQDPSARPTMRSIVDSLKTIQDLKHPTRFPLQEPGIISGKVMSRSPSLSGRLTAPKLSTSPSPTTRIQSVSSTRLVVLPPSFPP